MGLAYEGRIAHATALSSGALRRGKLSHSQNPISSGPASCAREGKISQSSELGQKGIATRQYFWHFRLVLPQK
jgi:hypothetical protein